ncbi:MAG TPA: DNA repair helicase XPB [Chitinivibrionales bacterium]|nr:DNA repair helicase XPB [Chitinivibrionales bacterium]
MPTNLNNPLIVQSNSTLLLEVNNPLFTDARDAITLFAHLEKSPEHIHTYSITPLSLWNAAALGMTPARVVELLETFSKYELPQNVPEGISELMARFGKLILEAYGDGLALRCTDADMIRHLARNQKLAGLIGDPIDAYRYGVPPQNRGVIKQALISLGYPVHDVAGYVDGDAFPLSLKKIIGENVTFVIREYQKQAAESYAGNPQMPGGSGVVVLPCGAGKTIVGMYVMSLLKRRTLILVTNVTAARQWKRELLDKTDIAEGDIGEYSGESKDVRPVTLATYQILTYRKKKTDPFLHWGLFNSQNWGLIIYDEVHLLPAPVFKFTADIQARRRLGLTATLIREDGHENDVFTLIGPKKFDVPWKDLERQGWIATARCVEIRVDLAQEEKLKYFGMTPREQIRLAYENPRKIPIVKELLEKHKNDQVLIMGQYLSQLAMFAAEFDEPVITGSTPNDRRDELYERFRKGDIRVLILSRVGNFAVDLPDANVAIQISGSFGSRQEEAQRLGRILRPKKQGDQAVFYSIVTRESRELDFAMNRQLFLTEQGYSYEIRYREFD